MQGLHSSAREKTIIKTQSTLTKTQHCAIAQYKCILNNKRICSSATALCVLHQMFTLLEFYNEQLFMPQETFDDVIKENIIEFEMDNNFFNISWTF